MIAMVPELMHTGFTMPFRDNDFFLWKPSLKNLLM